MKQEKKQFCYDYARPAVTVDCVIFGFDNNELKVLLTKRAIEPYLDKMAFCGGFIGETETADQCARRKLAEEASLSNIFLEQLYTYSDVARDPRFRVISIAYYALVQSTNYQPIPGKGVEAVQWFSLADTKHLAFDHNNILDMALQRLKGKIRYEPIGFELLPPKFTLPDLHKLYETILDRPIDRGNFRKKILSLDVLIDHSATQQNRRSREAKIYSFDKLKYEALKIKGCYFEL